jgi:CLIP, MHC2 interacting.
MVKISISQLFAAVGLALALLISGPTAWIVNQQVDRIEKLEEKIENMRAELPFKYVLRDELVRQLDRLEKAVNLVFERLDKKADK